MKRISSTLFILLAIVLSLGTGWAEEPDAIYIPITNLIKEDKILKGHSKWVNSVSFSPDGKLLASGGGDETIKLWDVATGREIKTLKGHSKWVESVSFSPDGRVLASGGGDETIKLWDVATGREIKTLKGHSKWVNSVSFSPDGRVLASGSGDNTIKLWDVGLLFAFQKMRADIESIEAEREEKIKRLYTPKGEFEKTKEYEERIRNAKVEEKRIRKEYEAKIREVRERAEREIKEEIERFNPYTLQVSLGKYDADREMLCLKSLIC